MAKKPTTATYTPAVGDLFHKPAGVYCLAYNGEMRKFPARSAEVTMVSPGHVVFVIDGKEHTMSRGDFIDLAKRTLENGATLSNK